MRMEMVESQEKQAPHPVGSDPSAIGRPHPPPPPFPTRRWQGARGEERRQATSIEGSPIELSNAMARIILRSPAVLLLPLVLLVLLSHLPSTTPATVTPLSKLLKGSDSSSSSSAPPPAQATSTTRQPSKEDKDDDDDDKQGNKAPAPMVSPTNGAGWYKGMAREFVNGHNKVRARYGVPPVMWDNKLALYARRWANAMRKDCVLKHSSGRYGESVFVGRDGWNATAEDALWMWGAEEPIYDKQTGNCTSGRRFRECGHFALMVNKDNRRIGCGRAECFNGVGVFISCNYYFLNRD